MHEKGDYMLIENFKIHTKRNGSVDVTGISKLLKEKGNKNLLIKDIILSEYDSKKRNSTGTAFFESAPNKVNYSSKVITISKCNDASLLVMDAISNYILSGHKYCCNFPLSYDNEGKITKCLLIFAK